MARLRGMTLVELLIVIAIIAAVLTLLLPAVQSAREAARRSQCAGNLRQLGIGLHAYHAANECFPTGCVQRRPFGSTDEVQLAWSVFLLPYLDHQQVFERFDTSRAFDDARNHVAASTVIPSYLCPSTARFGAGRTRQRTGDGLGATDYGGMFGARNVSPVMNGVMIFDRPIMLSEVSDGASKTIQIAEDTGRGAATDGQWANGENIFDQGKQINVHPHNEIWSDHPGGAQVLLCDGSVRFLHESIAERTLRALCTRAGHEATFGPD